MSQAINDALKNWVPYRLLMDNGGAFCQWLNLKDKKLVEPFFADTISVARETRSQRCVSDLYVLPEWAASLPAVPPSAFVFHVSRCGSTLLSQVLSLNESNIVLSEVPFLDELLRLHYKQPGADLKMVDEQFSAALCLYGQRRTDNEQNLFIKADCWHIFFYERLRSLYPMVPFFLLYRQPVEVLQSQQKKKGMQAVPGVIEPAIMGIEFKDNDPLLFDHDLYFATVLEKIMGRFLEVIEKDNNAYLLNYTEGAMNWLNKMASVGGFTISEEWKEQVKERANFHGKYPQQPFEKEENIEPPASLTKCNEYYAMLEEKRQSMALAQPV